MPDGGNKSGFQNQTSSSNNSWNGSTGANGTIAPMLDTLATNFWQGYGANPQAPAYYPGSTVAPMSDRTQAGLDAMFTRGRDGFGGGIDPAMRGLVADTLNGKYLDINNNKYFSSALSAAFQPQIENLNNQVLPNIDSKFAGSGRTAGGAHFDTNMRAVMDLDRAQSEAGAKAALGAYQGERGMQQSALNFLPTLQGMDYQNIASMMQAGQAQDAYNQRNIDADVARYNYNTTAQPEWMMRISQMLQGMVPGGTSSGSGSNSGYSFGSSQQAGGSSLIGNLMSGAGLGLAAYSAFSDARLKDVVGRVGETDEGVPLYLYKYKGEDRPQIGPMAQEVAQVKPDAVQQHESGFLTVDYSKLGAKKGFM